jgi:hypothetical protein
MFVYRSIVLSAVLVLTSCASLDGAAIEQIENRRVMVWSGIAGRPLYLTTAWEALDWGKSVSGDFNGHNSLCIQPSRYAVAEDLG